MTIAAVVLAAGAGTRFAGDDHKLLAPFRGSTVVGCAVAVACAAALDEVLVVTGAVDLTGALPEALTTIANPAWAEGIASSLAAALEVADAHGHDAVVVGLGDQPLVDASAWRAVSAGDAAGHPIVVATYGGRRANPVRLARAIWPLLARTGDEGARALMRRRPELVGEVACSGDPGDVDTVEDLERWS